MTAKSSAVVKVWSATLCHPLGRLSDVRSTDWPYARPRFAAGDVARRGVQFQLVEVAVQQVRPLHFLHDLHYPESPEASQRILNCPVRAARHARKVVNRPLDRRLMCSEMVKG